MSRERAAQATRLRRSLLVHSALAQVYGIIREEHARHGLAAALRAGFKVLAKADLRPVLIVLGGRHHAALGKPTTFEGVRVRRAGLAEQLTLNVEEVLPPMKFNVKVERVG